MVTFDIETVGDGRMIPILLDGVRAPSNYRDQLKIDQYLAERRAEVANDAAAKIDYNRVVCVSTIDEEERARTSYAEPNDVAERDLLTWAWAQLVDQSVVGFNIRQFDLPVLLRRSQVLGIDAPEIDLSRYANYGRVRDLADILTWRGVVELRRLRVYAHEFGIPVEDETTGADIPRLVAEGNWAAIQRHCESDVRTTHALAVRLGVIPALF